MMMVWGGDMTEMAITWPLGIKIAQKWVATILTISKNHAMA
jgi:hypothetical protein